jgi:hypothetical protein
MMFDWINDVSAITAFGVIALVFVTICWLGILALRPLAKSLARRQPGLNETVGDFLQYFGVIYGLLLGLLAVAVYQNLADVEKTAGNEAAALGALYRDVGAYPEPIRSEIQAEIRDYARFVIDEAWPLQQKGVVPSGAVKDVALIHERLSSFEPQTKGQEALHQTALRQFNTFFEYRRERLHSVRTSLPPVLWYTVIVGALLNMLLICLFDLRLEIHLLLGGILSFFLATMMTVTLLLDEPFRGAVKVPPDAYELVYDQLMKN